MTQLTKLVCSVTPILVSFCCLASASDIYRSENADGSFRYATQRLDGTYHLFLKNPDTSNQRAPLKTAPAVAARRDHLEPLIQQYAAKHQVDTDLVRAVIEVESNFNPAALSAKGASGAMQLMPATAARYGVTRRTDPAQNIEAGIKYLKDLLTMHNGNVALALASYNAGEGTIARYGKRIPPYKETMLYVPAVLTRLQASRNNSSPEGN